MSAGRGNLALAALILANGARGRCSAPACCSPLPTRRRPRLQGVVLPGIGTVPVQLIQSLPYLITVAILAGFVGTARLPRALGKPYSPAR